MPGLPVFGVALHFFAERSLGHVLSQALFKLGNGGDFVFEDDAVEVAGEVGENTELQAVESGGGVFELGGEFARMAGFGNEAVSNEDHDPSLFAAMDVAERMLAQWAGGLDLELHRGL